MVLCRREIDEMRLLPEDQWDISIARLPVYWIFPTPTTGSCPGRDLNPHST